jgi:hypothetical protein
MTCPGSHYKCRLLQDEGDMSHRSDLPLCSDPIPPGAAAIRGLLRLPHSCPEQDRFRALSLHGGIVRLSQVAPNLDEGASDDEEILPPFACSCRIPTYRKIIGLIVVVTSLSAIKRTG